MGMGGPFGLDFGAVIQTASLAGALEDGGADLLSAVLPDAEAAILTGLARQRETDT